ncbi:MerR family transcriptional regulator [Nafulsella turpanensis]|uniref:MerR family transcriptional regulator n=1 Tax=Nafulsella turpanensis TaxID=1265690 RepID=UPI000346B85D|nr:MerR family transcriptional regulator [Nafulsella turpanensis]
MSSYSIKDLEQLSGIKAHTLRIWEQRYNFITPKRTETNIRYYNDHDLKLILNVSLLRENGYKISKIAEMEPQQMAQAVLSITEKSDNFADQIHSLVLSMIDLDEERFEKILSTNILQNGFENTMLGIIFPFLNKIGILWQTGSINPAHEHFISNLIRQKLIVAIDGCYVSSKETRNKYLLFLPEGELHEISLLFCHYIIKSRKNKVVYLGQNVPLPDLASTYDTYQPNFLVGVLTCAPVQAKVQKYINQLGESFPKSKIFLSGQQVIGQDLKAPQNVEFFLRLDSFLNLVEELSAGKITG